MCDIKGLLDGISVNSHTQILDPGKNPVFSTVYRLFLSYFSICIKMTDGQLRFGTGRFSKRGRGAGDVKLQLTLRGGDDSRAKDEIPKEWSAMVNSFVFL